jgi:hypothetical protein
MDRSIWGEGEHQEPLPGFKVHVGRHLVKDGKNLPNSVTEDIHGYSICPWYSKMHIRRIDRLHRKKIRCCDNKNLSRIQRSKRNSLESKQGGVAVDSSGHVFVADHDNDRIQKVY